MGVSVRIMELKGGPPSHDSFSDLSDALDPEQLAVDGKVLRGAIMDASKQSALHLVQAFEPGADLVLDQMKVDGKSNETAAIPGLLEILVLVGRTAADAIHTRREASARIVEKGDDYVLPVKRNQKSMHKDVQVWFADPEARKEMLSCRHDWPGLKAVGRTEAVREQKGQGGAVRPPLHHERGDFAGAASGARPPPLDDQERPPLGSGRRHGRGPAAEPNPERFGMPLRPPAHRPEHRAPHGQQALARGTDGDRRHERQIHVWHAGQRSRQILRAKALGTPEQEGHQLCRSYPEEKRARAICFLPQPMCSTHSLLPCLWSQHLCCPFSKSID